MSSRDTGTPLCLGRHTVIPMLQMTELKLGQAKWQGWYPATVCPLGPSLATSGLTQLIGSRLTPAGDECSHEGLLLKMLDIQII